MLNKPALMAELQNNNCSIAELAAICNISCSSMYRRLKGDVDFKVGEIIKATGRLHLSIDRRNAIFFAKEV